MVAESIEKYNNYITNEVKSCKMFYFYGNYMLFYKYVYALNKRYTQLMNYIFKYQYIILNN